MVDPAVEDFEAVVVAVVLEDVELDCSPHFVPILYPVFDL